MTRKILALFIAFSLLLGGMVWGQEIAPAYDVNVGMTEALKAIKADEFAKGGIDGTGVKVAVIDTGIDVSHPDLQLTTGGTTKVIDVADFTDEGLVDTKPSVAPLDGFVLLEGKRYDVRGITTRSGKFHLGFLKEQQLDEEGSLRRDLNRNGRSNDAFGVLVSDSILPGIYDTVYVDSNMDFSFADEKPMKIYSKKFQWENFTWKSPQLGTGMGASFVISHVERDGSSVRISFDGNGHGTHVAGIIGARGRITGVAPGVQIIAIKALGSSGEGNWENIAKAVEYAQSQGANIINISVGNIASSWKEQMAQIQLMKKISRDRKTMIVLAAGNSGPGLSTAADVGGSGNVMTVGAYVSSPMWDINYGVQVPGDTLLHDTGVGPNADGSVAPSLVAPSMVTSTVPLWDTGGYYMMDGTSMAAPFVSGAAALIMQRARGEKLDVSVQALKQALERGARSIEGYNFMEQGYGVLDVVKAWEILQQLGREADRENIAVQLPGRVGYVGGTLIKEELWGNTKMSVTNLSNNLQDLVVESDSPWAIPENPRLLLPRGKPQSLVITYDFPKTPGLYTARITGNPQAFVGSKIEFLTSAVVPYDMFREGKLNLEDTLEPSRWKRYYFKVNPGTARLNFEFSITPRDEAIGRGLLYIYDPQGRKVFEGYAGSDYIASQQAIFHEVDKPTAGVWEAVVVSDYNLSEFGTKKTHYQLKVTTTGPTIDGDFIALATRTGLTQFSQEIWLKNGGEDFQGQIRGVGLADPLEPYNSSIMTVRDGEFAQGPSIKVADNAMNLEIRLEGDGIHDGDVDLYLYRKNPYTQQYEEIASSTKIDVVNEVIVVHRPLPGEYLAYIDGFSLPQGAANIKVNWRVLRDYKHLVVQDQLSLRRSGELWKIKLDVKVPASGSDFIGYLAVIDETGKEVSCIPVKLSVGKKELALKFDADTITVTEKDTQNPVDTTVIVNGLRYATVRGKANLPPGLNIKTVEVQDLRFAPLFWPTQHP